MSSAEILLWSTDEQICGTSRPQKRLLIFVARSRRSFCRRSETKTSQKLLYMFSPQLCWFKMCRITLITQKNSHRSPARARKNRSKMLSASTLKENLAIRTTSCSTFISPAKLQTASQPASRESWAQFVLQQKKYVSSPRKITEVNSVFFATRDRPNAPDYHGPEGDRRSF